MRIMYIAKVFAEWGGLERVWTDRLNALSEIPGYEVWLVTTDQGTHPYPYPFSDKVHLVDLDIRFVRQYRYGIVKRYLTRFRLMRLYKKRLLALFAEIRPDVLVTNSSENVAVLNRWRKDIPLVVECHGTCDRPFHMDVMTWRKRIKARFYYRSMTKADAIVALTQRDVERWKRYNSSVCAIPDIVHLNETKTYSACSHKRVIFVGRIDSQKGYQYLSAIWALVSQRHPDWRLDLYGEGVDRAENQNLIPKGENVFAHSQTSAIMDRYRESSILVLTSVYEPFGLVMAEAMSCGVPVVAFDCPYGPSEIITDGENGFLVDCFDVKAFAGKVCQLIEDKALRQRMGRNAISSVQRFSKEIIIPQWVDLFERVVRNR